MTVYFTSDTHFGHAKIIEYCRRPFASVDEMDEAMIRSWNEVVGEGDDVWHLGDFAAYRDGRLDGIFWRLNGRKRLVIGNHDEENPNVLALPWAEPPVPMRLISLEGKKRIFLCHYPLRAWPKLSRGAIHLHGHVHGRLPGSRISADAGVDCWSYQPVGLADIERRMRASRPQLLIDQPDADED